MADTIDAGSLARLLDDLLAWLKAHPNGDVQDFADSHNCSVDDISDSWNHYFSGDFSRKYNIDNHDYHPSTPPHGDHHAMKDYIVREVSNYQQFTTINNIEDRSFNQQIFAKGDVDQDIRVDNSDNIADHGGVVTRDSNLHDSNIVTGDRNVVDSDHANAVTGDVHTSADHGGAAPTNINFGGGNTNTTKAADLDVNVHGDNTSGDAGAHGGDGGHASTVSDADAGAGGHGGHLDDPFHGVGGHGGEGGDSAAAGHADAQGGDAHGGTSGDAGHHTDIHFTQ